MTLGKMLDAGRAERPDDRELPYIRAGNIQDDGFDLTHVNTMPFSSREANELSLRRNDLLIVEGGAVGTSYVVDTDMPGWSFQKTVNRVRARAGWSTQFLSYVLRTYRDVGVIDVICNKSTIPHLTAEKLQALRVPVPPIDQQRRIARYLDRETSQVDEMIRRQEHLIETLRERRRALFGHVFAGATGPSARLRHLFRPSAECNVPHEQVLSVYRDYGVIPKSSRADNFNRTPENLDRYLLVRPGDLVVNKMKAWQGSLGISNHRGIVSPDYEVLRKTDHRLLAPYAHHLLRSPDKIAEYALRSTGIRPSQWRLYWDQLGDITITLPSAAEQEELADRLETETSKIDLLIARAQRFIELSKERRSALIAAAVTGQIDVRGEVDPDDKLVVAGDGAA